MDDALNNMNFEIKNEHLPFYMRGRNNVKTTDINILLTVKKGTWDQNLQFVLNGTNFTKMYSQEDNGNLDILLFNTTNTNIDTLNNWNLQIVGIQTSDIEDIVIVFTLEVNN
jgi:hypothetical protein